MNVCRTKANIFLFCTCLGLTGCGAVSADIFKSFTPDQTADQPELNIPLGNITLALKNSFGKNRYVGFYSGAEDTAYFYNKYLIDNSNHLHYAAYEGISEYDISGVLIKKIPFPITSPDYGCISGREPMARSSDGSYFLLVFSNPSCRGVFKVLADGTTQRDITSVSLNPHPLPPAENLDIKIVKRLDNTEELHIIPMYLDNISYGVTQPNEVLVYDLNGNYLRSYGGSPLNFIYSRLVQSPLTKHVYAMSFQETQKIFHFDANGNYVETFTFSMITRINDIAIDDNNHFYILDFGDSLITGGGPAAGLTVFTTPDPAAPVLRQFLNTVSHPLYNPGTISVSADGSFVDLQNQYTKYRERYKVVAGQFQYSEFLGSEGSGANEFFFIGASMNGFIASDKSENIYVNDSGNQRIKVYDSDGNLKQIFSTYSANVSSIYGHAMSITANEDIYQIDWRENAFNDFNILLRKFTKSGVPLSSVNVPWPYNSVGNYIGTDDQERIWFRVFHTDASFNTFKYLVAVDSTGHIVKTIDFTDSAAVFGSASADYFKVVGSYIYYLDGTNLSTMRADFDLNRSVFVDASVFPGLGLLALIPDTFQKLSNGKFYSIALDNSYNGVMVIVDPEKNNEIVTKVTYSNMVSLWDRVWTSKGVFAISSSNRLLQLVFQ